MLSEPEIGAAGTSCEGKVMPVKMPTTVADCWPAGISAHVKPLCPKWNTRSSTPSPLTSCTSTFVDETSVPVFPNLTDATLTSAVGLNTRRVCVLGSKISPLSKATGDPCPLLEQLQLFGKVPGFTSTPTRSVLPEMVRLASAELMDPTNTS